MGRRCCALSNGFLVEWIDWVPDDLFAQMPVMDHGDFLIPDEIHFEFARFVRP